MFIFPLGGHAAADVAFFLILIQDLTGLGIERIVILLQPLSQILMYRGFGDTEVPGGGPDGGTGFNDVHSQFTGALLNRFFHRLPSDAVILN